MYILDVQMQFLCNSPSKLYLTLIILLPFYLMWIDFRCFNYYNNENLLINFGFFNLNSYGNIANPII